MSYLADVKSQLKNVFDEAFDYAWKDVIEPALKESYRNGVADGHAGKGAREDAGETKPRRQWGKQRATQRQSEEE